MKKLILVVIIIVMFTPVLYADQPKTQTEIIIEQITNKRDLIGWYKIETMKHQRELIDLLNKKEQIEKAAKQKKEKEDDKNNH